MGNFAIANAVGNAMEMPLLWSHHETFKNLSQWLNDGGRNAPSASSSWSIFHCYCINYVPN
jgi:hypothetical protein